MQTAVGEAGPSETFFSAGLVQAERRNASSGLIPDRLWII